MSYPKNIGLFIIIIIIIIQCGDFYMSWFFFYCGLRGIYKINGKFVD